jgi:hypothetical protein
MFATAKDADFNGSAIVLGVSPRAASACSLFGFERNRSAASAEPDWSRDADTRNPAGAVLRRL